MIDFVKVQLNVDHDSLIQTLIENGFEVGGHYDYDTSVSFKYPLKAWNVTLEVKFKSERYVELTGSIHKFAQDDKNHLDFSFKDLIETIITICKTLHLNPYNSFIRNIEFGVNIKPPFITKAFLKQVLCYGSTMFVPMKSKKGMSLGIQCELTQFRIKMYCKKTQYNLPDETMRFEIHVDKMHYLHEKGINIKTLADLMEIEYLKKFGDLLLKVYNEIVVIDKSIEQGDLSTAERKVYERWLNPKDIEDLFDENKSKFQYERRGLKAIQKKYSTEKRQEIIADLISDKLQKLLDVDSETSTILTNFKTLYPLKNFNHSFQLPKAPLKPDFNNSIHSNTGAESLKIPPLVEKDLFDIPKPKNISESEIEKKEIQVGKNDEKKSEPPAPKINEPKKTNVPENWDSIISELQLFFNSIVLPTAPVKLNGHTTIHDAAKFISGHMATVMHNSGNKTFEPYLERLIQFKVILSGQ